MKYTFVYFTDEQHQDTILMVGIMQGPYQLVKSYKRKLGCAIVIPGNYHHSNILLSSSIILRTSASYKQLTSILKLSSLRKPRQTVQPWSLILSSFTRCSLLLFRWSLRLSLFNLNFFFTI